MLDFVFQPRIFDKLLFVRDVGRIVDLIKLLFEKTSLRDFGRRWCLLQKFEFD